MRTATTVGKTSDGNWILVSGPDTPADKQRAEFNNIGLNWPKNLVEIRYQAADGLARTFHRDKAETQAKQAGQAIKKADEKHAIALKHQAEAEAEAKQRAEERASELKEAQTSAFETKEKSKKSKV